MTTGDEPKLRQPTRLRLVDDVAGVLADAILAGRMHPGERLVETWIGRELGVSRTTVREALLMLERRGLVRSKPRRGVFVTRLSRDEADDLCATRALLEAYALGVGYDRIDHDVLARLEGLIADMAACTLPDEVPRLIQIDLAFHHLLVDGAPAPRIRELWSSLDGQIGILFLTTLEQRHAGIGDVVAFHRDLLDAVRSGDVKRAQQAVIAHYNDAGNDAAGARIGGIVEALTSHQVTATS